MKKIKAFYRHLKDKIERLNNLIDLKLTQMHLREPKKKPSYFEQELPNIIQEFLINYGAGITLEASLKLTVKAHSKDNSLNKQLKINASTVDALNRFATQEDSKEVWRFVKLINQIHLTGATTSIHALEKYHDELWQNLLSKARMKSEKITILLTFLLMLSLISVIIVVLTPVMLMF